jgi:hypothetical protein
MRSINPARGRIVDRVLVLIAGLALSLALTGAPMTSAIELPKTANTGSFARYVPFGDRREVIVRRGKEPGFRYGFEQGRRMVRVQGGEFALVTYQDLLSPPPLVPGQEPLSAEAAKQYEPVFEVLYLPDAEVLIPREPSGFTDAEVERILDAIFVR